MNDELIKELEEMRIKLDSMIKRVDYEDPAFDILVNVKGMLGYAQFDLNQLS